MKPLARVRSPTTPFSEKISPGFSTVPLINSAARPMLTLRYSRYGKWVVNCPVTRLMPSFLASAVENLALAPDSSTATVRPRPDSVSAGSTAFFRSAAATTVPLTAAMTFGLPLTRRTVASFGSVSSTFLTAGAALDSSFLASRSGTSLPSTAANVMAPATISGSIENEPAAPAVTLIGPETAGLAKLLATRMASSSLIWGCVTAVGSSIGAGAVRKPSRISRRSGGRVDGQTGLSAGPLDRRALVRQRRVDRRLVDGGGQLLHGAVQLLFVHDDDRLGGPASDQHGDDLAGIEAPATSGRVHTLRVVDGQSGVGRHQLIGLSGRRHLDRLGSPGTEFRGQLLDRLSPVETADRDAGHLGVLGQPVTREHEARDVQRDDEDQQCAEGDENGALPASLDRLGRRMVFPVVAAGAVG